MFQRRGTSTSEWRPAGREVRLDSGLELDRLLPRPLLLHRIVLACDFMLKDSCCLLDETVAAGMKKRSDKKRLKNRWGFVETEARVCLCRGGFGLCSGGHPVPLSCCAL